jgi:DNA-binding Lrp family transcriptional regulator
MSGTTWSKFYWSDWLSDPGLRNCSLAARGLWIEMLCIAAQSDPIGYLAIKGQSLTVHDTARMVGGSAPEVAKLIEELERNGVLSRDRNGTIYNRRLVRDAKRSREAKKNGKEGGNPSLRKQRGNPSEDNPRLKGTLKPHKPYANSQDTNSQESKKKVRGANAPPTENVVSISRYAFEGRIIRLSQAEFDRWRESYFEIKDMLAALQAADDYYFQNQPKDGKWFFPVSRWLQREHTAALEHRAKADKEELRRRGDAW